MAKKISELPSSNFYQGNEKILMVQDSITKAGSMSLLAHYLSGVLVADSELAKLSGDWENTYSTVQAASATWDGHFCDEVVYMKHLSACGETNTLSITGDIDMNGGSINNIGTNSITFETGATISSDNSNIVVNGLLSAYALTDHNGMTSDQWDAAYTTVHANSATWAEHSDITELQATSATWNDTSSVVQTNSAAWDAAAGGNFCDTTLSLNQVSACSNDTITITGTVSSTNLITSTLSADGVFFNTGASHTPALGELVWDNAENTLDLGLTDGVVLQVGEEQLINAKAAEEIKNGQVVYASGAVGAGSGKIEVSLYSASSAEGVDPGTAGELFFVGMATQDIALNNFGYITTFGKVRDVAVKQGNTIDTVIVGPENANASSSDPDWELGTVLYISTSAGRLTNTEPISPNKIIPAAMVIGVNGNSRTLFARYEHGYHIDELHDVRITSIQPDDILAYNDTDSVWENKSTASWDDTSSVVQTNSASWDNAHRQQLITTSNGSLDLDVSLGESAITTLTNHLTSFTISNAVSGDSGMIVVSSDGGGWTFPADIYPSLVMSGDLADISTLTNSASSRLTLGWYYDGEFNYLFTSNATT